MGDFKRNSSAGAGFDDNNGHDLSNKPAISGKKSAILKTSGISEKAVSASLSDPVVDKYGKPKNVSSLFLIGVAEFARPNARSRQYKAYQTAHWS